MLYYLYMLDKQDGKTIQDIADKIRKHRLARNMKQTDVADKADLNSNYYARVERGEASPSIITLKKICRALRVKSSDILPF